MTAPNPREAAEAALGRVALDLRVFLLHAKMKGLAPADAEVANNPDLATIRAALALLPDAEEMRGWEVVLDPEIGDLDEVAKELRAYLDRLCGEARETK